MSNMQERDSLVVTYLEKIAQDHYDDLNELLTSKDPLLQQVYTLGMHAKRRYEEEQNRQRGIELILDTMMQIAGGDFDIEVKFDRQDPLLDALMVSLNMMGQELKAVTLELAVARDAAIEANTAKSQFLASMSHELRTPLNAIIGYAELIREDALDDGHEHIEADAQKILSASRHLLGIISDILDLSKIEAGHVEMSLEGCSVDRLCEEVCATINPLIQSQGNQFVFDSHLPYNFITSDKMRLNQILLNLLSNANKFTKQGKITLEVYDEGPYICFAVSDSGIGIAQERLEAIFDPFVQEDGSTTRRFGGTGLGLAISQRLANMLGGNIFVRSERGQGSTFTLKVLANQTSFEERWSSSLEEVSSTSMPEEQTEVTIFALDDDPHVIELLHRHLKSSMITLHGFQTGRQFMQALEAAVSLPDLIILDIELPDTSGWSILAQLQLDTRFRDIPVIVITITDNKTLGFSLGASDYLIKPINFAGLLPAIFKHLQTQPKQLDVLLVDDDPDIQALVKRALRPPNYNVRTAYNGFDALNVLKDYSPHVILLDLMMPEMDGFELYEHLQRDKDWSQIPVVVISALQLSKQQRSRLSTPEILTKDGTTYTQLDKIIAQTLTLRPAEDIH